MHSFSVVSPRRRFVFQTEISGKYIVLVLISLLFYFFSSLRRGDQSTVFCIESFYFNWSRSPKIRHPFALVCRCGLADITNSKVQLKACFSCYNLGKVEEIRIQLILFSLILLCRMLLKSWVIFEWWGISTTPFFNRGYYMVARRYDWNFSSRAREYQFREWAHSRGYHVFARKLTLYFVGLYI